MISVCHPPFDSPAELPREFTLRLGPHSDAQVAALARTLRDLGAQVAVERDGALVAQRPNE